MKSIAVLPHTFFRNIPSSHYLPCKQYWFVVLIFQVDRVIDQLLQFITTYDILSLKELWAHLDQRMFSKLEHEYALGIRKLESSLYKFYLVNAISNNKHEKINDFFSKMPELQGQPEWRDWFSKLALIQRKNVLF